MILPLADNKAHFHMQRVKNLNKNEFQIKQNYNLNVKNSIEESGYFLNVQPHCTAAATINYLVRMDSNLNQNSAILTIEFRFYDDRPKKSDRIKYIAHYNENESFFFTISVVVLRR
ncbi:hypothetical protein NPIL_370001 [Nephila pilipes]|uniref:Uncharacterized protein n=1 Tax=Nephila pilipes TaxID=299642 RepID=A0A8X6MQZ1_NEPPI|nr:hypothetical protein NPIL_370001 [Nephila pilipes]